MSTVFLTGFSVLPSLVFTFGEKCESPEEVENDTHFVKAFLSSCRPVTDSVERERAEEQRCKREMDSNVS